MNWEPKYDDWEEVQVPNPAEFRARTDPAIFMTIPAEARPQVANRIDWFNWAQRAVIAVLICIVAVMIWRDRATSDNSQNRETPAVDWVAMDQAANAARAKVYDEIADKAAEFKDLQSLVKWQDEKLRAARLEAYQPWVDLLAEQLDEDRYDAKVAESIFRQAAKQSN